MIDFYPAIDLKNGKCIRLKKGSLKEITEYSSDPVKQALSFCEMGAKWLHIVDIDGAFKGESFNKEIILEIIKNIDCKIQLGGGIRDISTVEFFISNGVNRLVVGTTAVKNPRIVKQMCKLFPGKIALGIDARSGYVAVEGWSKLSKISIIDLAKKYQDAGVSALIYTDIEKDGVLEGMNHEELSKILNSTTMNVIVSGGVSTLDDLKKLKKLDAENLIGVISGRAIYENKFSVKDAIHILGEKIG